MGGGLGTVGIQWICHWSANSKHPIKSCGLHCALVYCKYFCAEEGKQMYWSLSYNLKPLFLHFNIREMKVKSVRCYEKVKSQPQGAIMRYWYHCLVTICTVICEDTDCCPQRYLGIYKWYTYLDTDSSAYIHPTLAFFRIFHWLEFLILSSGRDCCLLLKPQSCLLPQFCGFLFTCLSASLLWASWLCVNLDLETPSFFNQFS